MTWTAILGVALVIVSAALIAITCFSVWLLVGIYEIFSGYRR